jgi:hypothetical protein
MQFLLARYAAGESLRKRFGGPLDFALGTLLGCAPKAAAWSAVGVALG